MVEQGTLEGRRSPVIGEETLVVLARLAQQPGALSDRAEALVSALAVTGLTCAVRWCEDGQLTTLASGGPQATQARAVEPEAVLRDVLAGQPTLVDDLAVANGAADLPWREGLATAGLRSAALLPLSDPDGVRGVLALFSDEPEAWSNESPLRLALVSQLAVDALSDAPDGAVPAGPPESLLREAFVVLHLDRDADDLCRRAVQQTARVLETDFAMVARADEGRHHFTCYLEGERYDIGAMDAPLLRQVAQSRDRLEAPHTVADGDLQRRLATAGVGASLALPLDFQGENFGVMVIGYRDPQRLCEEWCNVAEELAFHIALSLRDSRLQRAQEQALARLRQAQEEATQGAKFRALAQMAGGVAHEFNNALGGILARAQMLQRQTRERSILSGLNTIAEIGWRAAETVRRLQEFTRERSEEDFEPLGVANLWEQMREGTRLQVATFSKNTGLRYVVELEHGDLAGSLQANAEELLEAVGNVVANALEATPGGGVVMVHADTAGGQFRLSIADRGRGMTQEVLQSCLDPFFSTKAETGVGLGLSVTYGIVSRHRGEIEIDSSLESGTTVEICLPLAGASRASAAAAVPTVPHILIIDDEIALCEVLSELFNGSGYTTETCAGGREGIDKFQDGAFDLVCTDLRTEDLSGWEVIRAVKDSGRGTPVMLLTGFREQLRPDQIESSGVDAVLGKPFTLQQVLSQAEKLLHPEGT